MNINRILNIDICSRQFLMLTPREQIDLLISQSNPMKVVKSLPSQYIAFTIKEVGIQDCLEFLELVSTSQLKEILDFDIWDKDCVNSKKLLYWLNGLISISIKLAIKHFHNLDIELIALLFKIHSVVYNLFDENNSFKSSDIFFITPDQKYGILFHGSRDHESLLLFLKYYVEKYYNQDINFMSYLLESIRWETLSSLLESSYQLKITRFLDFGIIGTTDSLKLFSYVDPSRMLLKFDFKHINKPIYRKSKNIMYTSVFSKSLIKYKIIINAIMMLTFREQKKLIYDIYSTINIIQLELYGTIMDNKTIKQSSHFVLCMIEIALSYLSCSTAESVIYLLKYNAKKIFNIGYSVCLQPKRYWCYLKRIYPIIFNRDAVKCLDFPLDNVISGLNANRPMFFEGLTDTKKSNFDIFEKFSEVICTTNALLESVFRIYLISIGLKEDFCNSKNTCSQIFSTYICWYLIGKKPQKEPLDQSSFLQLFNRLISKNSLKFFSSEDRLMANKLGFYLAYSVFYSSKILNLKEGIDKTKKYINLILDNIEEEFNEMQKSGLSINFINSILINSI